MSARRRDSPTPGQFFDEVDRWRKSFTRQHQSRVGNALVILRDELKPESIEDLADERFEDRLKQHLRGKGLTDSQEESRLKGHRSILRYGEERGYFECPEFGPLRKGPGKRGPLKGHNGRQPTIADLYRLWMRLERGKDSFAGGRIRITVCMVGFVGLSLEATRNLCRSQIVDGGTAITYESRHFLGTRHKFLSNEIAQILAEWLENPELQERAPLSAVDDCWIVPNTSGDGPWDRDSNPPEHPLGHLEAACTAAGIGRMTFEDIHVLHVSHKITGPAVLADLAMGVPLEQGVTTGRRRPSVVIGGPREPVRVFDVDQGTLSQACHAVLKRIFDSKGKGVGVDELEKVTGYPRDRIADLRKHSDELDRLIVRTGGHAGSKVVYNFSEWWLE